MLDRCRGAVALALAVFTLGFQAVPPGLASEAAVLTGKVFQPDGTTPRAGIVVHLVEPSGEKDYGSRPTGPDGTFRVEGAPAGTYRVLAESPEGAYLAPEPVAVRPGQNEPLSLSLGGPAPALGAAASNGATPQSGGGLPRWSRWAIAGGIVILALFVIDEVTEEKTTSPAL